MKKTLLKLSPLALLPALPLVATISCSNNQVPTPPENYIMVDENYPALAFNSSGYVWANRTILDEEGKDFVIPEVLTNTSWTMEEYRGFQVKPKYIGKDAFRGQKGLSSIKLPESIIDISGYSFAETNLTKVTIPSSMINIGPSVFKDCVKLSKVNFAPNSKLEYIYMFAFENTALEGHLNIPSSVIDISVATFRGTKLTSVNISNLNCRYSYDSFPDGCQVTGGIKE